MVTINSKLDYFNPTHMCSKSTFHRLLAGAVIGFATVVQCSCSHCWSSLNTAEAVLHCDKRAVVLIEEASTIKYRYQGQDWYPVKLAYAVDKGKSIFRRGDGCPWCKQDTTDRFQIQQESVCTCMIPCKASLPTRAESMDAGMEFCFEQAIAEKDFPFAKAMRLEREKGEKLPGIPGERALSHPYREIGSAVACMPITEEPPQPTMGRRIAAAPLHVVDCAATIAMDAAEAAVFIVLLPPLAIRDGIRELIGE